MIRRLCQPPTLPLPGMALLNPKNWNTISPFRFHVQPRLFSSKVSDGIGEAANKQIKN